MKCNICDKQIKEGDHITRYALGSSSKHYLGHEECVAGIVLKDLVELWHGQYVHSEWPQQLMTINTLDYR